MTSTLKEYLNHLNTVYSNSLNEDAPTVPTPPALNIPLHAHQTGILARMEKLESDSINGTNPIRGERIFSNYGILGDSVGVGKSLMVLGHIARINLLPPLEHHTTIQQNSSSNFFSIKTRKISDLSEAGCLLIIPHTLFRQWSDYIDNQTTLKSFSIARLAQIHADNFTDSIFEAEVVLISNTLLKPFTQRCIQYDIRWKRLFIDEADSIHMPGINMKDSFKTRFTWFITASWINLLYINNNLYFDKVVIQSILANPDVDSNIKSHFKSRGKINTYYYIESLRVRSFYFLRDVLSISHPLRSTVVLRCSENYIKKSISLPALYKQVILCRTPISHDIIRGAVSPAIQQMLHAGDTEGALSELGVKGQTAKALIEAVTTNLQKELIRLEKTYIYKASLEYSTAQAKELALLSLTTKIKTTKESIEAIETRIKSFGNSACPICLDESDDYLITPCCSQAFCPPCLLLSISTKPFCPLCRASIKATSCRKLITSDISANEIVELDIGLPKKHDALLQILKDNPGGKFLIFSRYDNPFETIGAGLESLDITVKHLKGNKDAIKSTLTKFETGKIQCLLLNSRFAGAGLNITAATHVILLHAMTHEEEKQILGRAYRVGRVGPLAFIKLLHENEENYSELPLTT
jgi:SNF2 family DNA or RNA helicase